MNDAQRAFLERLVDCCDKAIFFDGNNYDALSVAIHPTSPFLVNKTLAEGGMGIVRIDGESVFPGDFVAMKNGQPHILRFYDETEKKVAKWESDNTKLFLDELYKPNPLMDEIHRKEVANYRKKKYQSLIKWREKMTNEDKLKFESPDSVVELTPAKYESIRKTLTCLINDEGENIETHLDFMELYLVTKFLDDMGLYDSKEEDQ